jgi:hypothetical protein
MTWEKIRQRNEALDTFVIALAVRRRWGKLVGGDPHSESVAPLPQSIQPATALAPVVAVPEPETAVPALEQVEEVVDAATKAAREYMARVQPKRFGGHSFIAPAPQAPGESPRSSIDNRLSGLAPTKRKPQPSIAPVGSIRTARRSEMR